MDVAKSRSRSRRRRSSSRVPVETHEYNGIRSRDELLHTRVMAPDEFLRSVSQYGPNGSMDRNLRLKPIALVLRPGESTEKYEENFQKWLRGRNLAMKALENDPEEERRLRQCFAYVRANTADLTRGRRSPSRSRKRSRSPVRARPEPKRTRVEEEKKESIDEKWASRMTKQVAELQEQVNRRFQEMEREVGKLKRTRKEEDAQDHEVETESLLVADETEARPVDVVANGVYKQTDRSAEVVKAATEILKKAAIAKSDPAQKRLVKDYTRLSNQIVMNETAMEDSLAYVETLDSAGEDEAAEHLSQIKELQSSIDNEKQRRDTTLAAVIAQEWKEKREGFDRMVRQRNEALGTRHASHEQLAEVYSKLDANGEEVVAVQAKLKNRLSWAGHTSTDGQFQELAELSNELSMTLLKRSTLEIQRQKLCVDLLRSNDGLLELAKELIEEAHLWCN